MTPQPTPVSAAVQTLAPWQSYICHACGYIYNEAEGDLDLLRHDGCREPEIPATVVLALCQQEKVWGSSMVQPHELPGIDNYLLGFGQLIAPASVSKGTKSAPCCTHTDLSASQRVPSSASGT